MTERDFSQYDPEVPMYCVNHPNTQTYVRCGRCEKSVCERCRVRTPAGIRCYDCANMQVVPTFMVSGEHYMKAALGGLIAAALGGTLMGLFPAFEFWAALLIGIAVPEMVAMAANQKRSQGLQMLGVACVAFGFIISRVVMSAVEHNAIGRFLDLGGINRASLSGISFLDNMPFHVTQYTILWLALAVFLAYRRLQ